MKLKCKGAVAITGGKQVAYVIIFLPCLKSFHRVHSLKNDPSFHIIIDAVNQEESCPDPIKNIKKKTKYSIHKGKKKNHVFWDL